MLDEKYKHTDGTYPIVDNDETDINSNMTNPPAKVPGYNIFIILAGNLDNGEIMPEVLEHALKGMADFYLSEKISSNGARFKKFKDK